MGIPVYPLHLGTRGGRPDCFSPTWLKPFWRNWASEVVYFWKVYPLVNVYKKLENHHVSWVNQRFRLGHVPVRKLFVYQRLSQWSWWSHSQHGNGKHRFHYVKWTVGMLVFLCHVTRPRRNVNLLQYFTNISIILYNRSSWLCSGYMEPYGT